MNVFLTAAQEVPVIQKFWNIVDWVITSFDFSVNAAIAANIAGAQKCRRSSGGRQCSP